MAPRLRVVGRDSDQTMHPNLRLEEPVGIAPLDLELDPLDPRLFARFQVEDRHREPVAFRPARVHPREHLRPVLRFWSVHSAPPPSAMVRSSSARRVALASTSKKAPEFLEPSIECGETLGQWHWAPALLSMR